MEAIQVELERIVNSKLFVASPRLVRFLRYCVEQTCDGRSESLKESLIGVHVFDRLPSYDPKVDPIVRVHARRLREKLAVFYDSEGWSDLIIRLPKGGYVARFEETAPQPTANLSPQAEPVVEESNWSAPRRGGRRKSIALALCAAGLAAFAWFTTRRDLAPLLAQTKVQPLVSLPGSANDPSWAPDGRTIAFTWDGRGAQTSKVYILKNGETVPAELTNGTQAEYHPAWSPDGKSIGLLRETEAHRFTIVVVHTATKVERVVRTISQLSPAGIPPALDWSTNGEWLVSSEQPMEGPQPVHLLLVSPKDGRSWVITDPPNGSTGDLEARFSPDSKRILFRRGGHGELFTLSLNGTAAAPPTQITFQNAGVRGLSWSRDGKAMYFGSQRERGQFGIWRLREGEATPAMITPENVAAVAPAIDPRGKSLVFAQPAVDVNLWRYELRHPFDPYLLVPSTHAEYSPEFSPDGQQLAFISDRSGVAEIWISGLQGGQPRKVTSLRAGDLPMSPSWSPDGTKIAYFCRRNGLNFAYQTDVNTGATVPLRSGEDYALFPQYSADGKSFYYVSNSGHRFRIWSEPLSHGGSAEPVVGEEVRFFRISKDREYLYFIGFHNPGELIQVKLSSKEQKVLWTFPDSLATFDSWDVAGGRLFYVNSEPASVSHLAVVDLNTGYRRVLGTVRRLSREWQTSIAASPDGQSAIVTQVDSDRTALMFMRLD